MGVSETCFRVDFQKVHIFKNWSDIDKFWSMMSIYKIDNINAEKIRTNKFFLCKILFEGKWVFHDKVKFLVIFWRSSSTEGWPPPMVIFHQRLSSSKGHLPPKVVFKWRSSSNEGHLPLKVFFQQRSSSTKGCLPLKVVLHQRLSST